MRLGLTGMRGSRNAYRIFVVTYTGELPLRRPRWRKENNIKEDI
jgi:hypothetical protein